ncbi:MAG: Aryl-alcohol dehydrogenase [Chlamydiae bacterium]|nr:Aryl-alcohol dehydrogenase [Chlamydiota bacterium]
MKTKAAVLVNLGVPLEIWELDTPSLQEGQVLVEIAYSGLCHSQLNEINGLKGEDHFLPHTLGHEGSGVVLEIGEGVTKTKPGDHVVLSWIKGEGKNAPGCKYQSTEGVVNSGAISTFLTHAVISENRLIPIPKEMPLREAALLGCAIPTGAGVVRNEMNLKAGQSFAVFGAGGIGLSALIAAKHAKADPIVAIDVNARKLERAKAMGATHVIDARTSDPVAALAEITSGNGVDYIFESAGKKEAMEKAFCSLKAPGMCVLAGNLPQGQKIEINPFDLIRGKKIVGTWGGKSDIDRDVLQYVDLFLNNEIDLKSLITHEVKLEEVNSLIHELEQGSVGRGLIGIKKTLS